MKQKIFEKYESEVRSYCRKFPTVFTTAKNAIMTDDQGREYIDFLGGAGSLNYGHNNDYIKDKVIEYLQSDGIIHGLDLYTDAKLDFIEFFEEKILKPRDLDYKVLFPGPTGTNAVEVALKLARKIKGRSNVFALMGGFHGMTLASLALCTDRGARNGAGVPLNNVTHVPAPGLYDGLDTIQYMESLLTDDHSGIEKPAALIVEALQGEGGINIMPTEWLKAAREFCDKHDILLILDEVQMGCTRTGTFFAFERAEIKPDIVVMAKSMGGIGMPFALTLLKPELDAFNPGEHNGTFRGFQLAMVAGKASLEYFLENDMENETVRKGKIVEDYIKKNILPLSNKLSYRGMGLVWGIDMGEFEPGIAKLVSAKCFEHGLIIELAGREDAVVKIMPPLTIEDDHLMKGLDAIKDSLVELKSKLV